MLLRRDPSVRFASLLAAGGAVALAVSLLAGMSFFAVYERREAIESGLDRGELLARVLEDHVTRTMESAGIALSTIAESAKLQSYGDLTRMDALLGQTLVGLPFMRSVAMLDMQGQVLSSTASSELGLLIDLRVLGPLPVPGAERLGGLLRVRGLNGLALGKAHTGVRGVGVLPLMRQLQLPGGRRVLLLGLINPDALATYQQTAMSGVGGAAFLASYSGQLLAATQEGNQEPGTVLEGHPVFRDWLPAREHGRYVGVGAMSGEQLVAFRVSRSHPLLVIVEQDRTAVLQAWRESLRGLVAIGLLGLLLIAAATMVVLRSLRARQRSRVALNEAHDQVALRERELSVLMRSLQELVFRTDAQGRLTFVNARWGAISSDRAEQAIGVNLSDLVEPEDRDKMAALFNPAARDGVRNAEASLRRDDGSLLRFDVAVVPLRDQQQVVGYAGSAVDVTDRYVAQHRLQQELAFTGLLLEISPQPVSLVDPQGRYVSVNQAWEDFTGQQRAAVIGQPRAQCIPAEEAAMHATQDARLFAEGGRLRYEMQELHRDGSMRDVVITKVVVPDGQGGMAGILSTLMDVSEFRDAERATREARDVAEQASRAKSEFVANISHELRTPLQSILGFSELGLARGREHIKLASMFQDIHASGQRMLALVNDLLDVSKIESSVGTFDLERTDLRDLMQEAMSELKLMMGNKRLRPVLVMPPTPLSARVDPLRLQQVLRNVLANAIKFSPEGRSIELKGALESGEQGFEVHLSVADRGPGIPPAELEQIFEAFVQSSQTKDGSGGTGLGLAICRKIVEIHGGRISAENREGGGAVFHIRLPAKSGGDTQFDSSLDSSGP